MYAPTTRQVVVVRFAVAPSWIRYFTAFLDRRSTRSSRWDRPVYFAHVNSSMNYFQWNRPRMQVILSMSKCFQKAFSCFGSSGRIPYVGQRVIQGLFHYSTRMLRARPAALATAGTLFWASQHLLVLGSCIGLTSINTFRHGKRASPKRFILVFKGRKFREAPNLVENTRGNNLNF